MNTTRRGWAGKGSTTAWRKLRLQILARDNWQCQIIGPRCTGTADSVDHITALADRGAFLDPTNCRAACQTCNKGRRDHPPAPTTTTIEIRTHW